MQGTAAKPGFWWLEVDHGSAGPLMPQMYHEREILGLASLSMIPGREWARGLHDAAHFVSQNDTWMAEELTRMASEGLRR